MKDTLKTILLRTIGVALIGYGYKQEGFKAGQKAVIDSIKTTGEAVIVNGDERVILRLNKK